MSVNQNAYADPHPELLIPSSSFSRSPAPEALAQIVAVLLLLAAWVAIVYVMSSGLIGTSEQPPAVPVERPAYLSA